MPCKVAGYINMQSCSCKLSMLYVVLSQGGNRMQRNGINGHNTNTKPNTNNKQQSISYDKSSIEYWCTIMFKALAYSCGCLSVQRVGIIKGFSQLQQMQFQWVGLIN